MASEAAPELSPSRSAAADENVQEQVWGFQKNPIAAAQPSWRAFDPGANPECEGGCAMQSGFDPRKINGVLSKALHRCFSRVFVHQTFICIFFFPKHVTLNHPSSKELAQHPASGWRGVLSTRSRWGSWGCGKPLTRMLSSLHTLGMHTPVHVCMGLE